jgi:N-acetylmuramic acid 6-phosphate etherase
MIDLTHLTTEMRNPETMDLDEMTPLQLATVMNAQDRLVADAVEKVLPKVATAIEWACESLRGSGRIIYLGAGTSGRLGVLDAVECPPTFGVSPDVVVGLIAGGEHAFVKAAEGVEDSLTLCAEDLDEKGLTSRDIVIGLAASGRTPYVIGGLDHARAAGCHTVAVSCNAGSEVSNHADLAIEAIVGPEVLTGSTRLKAGTAQKMILNMISTGAMVGMGKAYQNLMVDVQQSNKKLVVRAQNITMQATGCTRDEAIHALDEADGHVKRAVVMVLAGVGADEARRRLDDADGHVRRAIR